MSYWLPWAEKKPLKRNYTNRKRARTDGIILHVAVSESKSLFDWFSNPAARASSHLYVRRDGTVEQYVDLDLISWASQKGDKRCISVETQGMGEGEWTDAQVKSLVRIIQETSRHYGYPLRLMTSSKGEKGVGWHRLGVPLNVSQKIRGVSQTGGELWSGSPGKICFPIDTTDILTDHGWVGLADITEEHNVASVDLATLDMSFAPATIVEPHEAHVIQVGGHFESTPDHEWVVAAAGRSTCLDCGKTGKRRAIGVHRQHTGHEVQRSTAWVKIPAVELRRSHILPVPNPRRTSGVLLTRDQIRMAAWLFADGHYMKSESADGEHYGIEWHFAKRRKVDRVVDLLDRLKVPYSLGDRIDGTYAIRVWGEHGRYLISILPSKSFGSEWFAMNRDQVETLWDELIMADGDSTRSHNQRLIFSTDKGSLDVIQAVSIMNGLTCSMWKSGPLWWLRVRENRQSVTAKGMTRRTLVSCVTTVHGTVVIRQNGRVVVTGNCPGPDRIKQIPGIVAQARGNTTTPRPEETLKALADEAGATLIEKDEIDMKMIGIYWKNQAGKTVYALVHPVSGFYAEHSGVSGGYNNALAAALETGSWVEVSEAHARGFEQACAQVRGEKQ